MVKNQKPKETKDLLKKVGGIVKRIRLTKKIRQSEITTDTGLSQNIVTNLETGKGSSLTSFLAILDHLELTEILFAALDAEAGRSEKLGERCKPAKKQVLKSITKLIKRPTLDSYEGVSTRELKSAENENIELSVALIESEFFPALKQHPDRVFRIWRELAVQLIGDSTSSIAVFAKKRIQKTLVGSHEYTVYYATSLQKSAVLDLSWIVGGFEMTFREISDLVH
jgi:transcriptional regulator with XRE-family HTH domain